MTETESSDYLTRTELNVLHSDGTIRIATNFSSSGEKATLRFIKQHNKPHFDINPETMSDCLSSVYFWVITNNIRIINIAGNSTKTSPGIYQVAYNICFNLFSKIKENYASKV